MKIHIGNRIVSFSLILIFIVQLLVFLPSFKLALFGDDWLAFWRYWWLLVLDKNSYGTGIQGHVTYFLTPYGPQDILMGFLYKIFNFQSIYYYLLSFSLRYFLSVTVFITIYKLLKDSKAALIGGIFTAVTTIGLDTTNWVFNMTSYLGILFLVVFVYFYILSFTQNHTKNLLAAYSSLFFAIIIVPIRTHGIIPLVLFTEAYLFFISSGRKKIFRRILGSIVLFVATFTFIGKIGDSFAQPGESLTRVFAGLEYIRNAIYANQDYSILLSLFSQFGNMLLPQNVWIVLSEALNLSVIGRPRPFPFISLLFFLIFLLLISLTIIKKTKGKNLAKLIALTVFGLMGNVLVYIVYKSGYLLPAPFEIYATALLGMYILIYLVGMIMFGFIDPRLRIFTLISTVWPIFYILLPWFSNPWSIFETSHRYMIASAIGVAFILALLYRLAVNKKIMIVVVGLVITLHAWNSYTYLYRLIDQRGTVIADKLWNFVDERIPHLQDGDDYFLVYFEGDTTNGLVVHNNLFFGFPPRSGLRDQLSDSNTMPFAITSYEELRLMTLFPGDDIKAHGKIDSSIPIDRVYTFKITGKTPSDVEIEETTDLIREKLQEEKLELANN